LVSDSVHAEALDAIQCGLIVNQVAHLLGIGRADVARLFAKGTTSRGAAAPAESPEPPGQGPRTPEQTAWKTALEVLLNRLDLVPSVSPRPDVSRIADLRDRRIATALFEASPTTVAEVLAHCSTPECGARVAELAERGAQRGNFEATLSLSLTRIGLRSHDDAVERHRREWLETGGEPSPELGKETHRALCDGVKEHRHFVPRRLRRGMEDGLGGNAEETVGAAP